MNKYVSGLAVAALMAAGASLLAQGAPQFVTRPILLHVGEVGLDHGHFVFADEAAMPSPLVRDLGAATFGPAAVGGTSLVTGTNGTYLDVNVSKSPDSYEGETGATGAATANGLIVAGSNHIYPGSCNAAAASGTFGDCAPLAYASTDGANFTRTSLPRTWNNTAFGIGFDPAVDVDSNGTFYYSYGVAPLAGNYPNAIVVVKSTDGVTWTKAAPVTFNTNKAFDDKYYLAVDRSTSSFANRVYVSWDRNQGTTRFFTSRIHPMAARHGARRSR